MRSVLVPHLASLIVEAVTGRGAGVVLDARLRADEALVPDLIDTDECRRRRLYAAGVRRLSGEVLVDQVGSIGY
ncbi:hypothetical protein [Pseudonocardia sp.]|uniref:hypothetical protein n=1 Tax=Pseudonocardia sp. TaxID=60912 RepID=UPI0031FDC06F